jgi:hypothetical protein
LLRPTTLRSISIAWRSLGADEQASGSIEQSSPFDNRPHSLYRTQDDPRGSIFKKMTTSLKRESSSLSAFIPQSRSRRFTSEPIKPRMFIESAFHNAGLFLNSVTKTLIYSRLHESIHAVIFLKKPHA